MAGESCDLEEALRDFWADYSIENTDFPTCEAMEEGKAGSLELARLFLEETDLDPLEAEYRFSPPVVNVVTGEVLPDLELVGVIDLIDRTDGRYRAIEIKTKSRRPDAFSAKISMELTCYAYWLRFLDEAEAVPVSYVNIIKNKKPYVLWQDQERVKEDFVDLFHTIKNISENINECRCYKNPGVHCNWCDFRPVCSKDTDVVEDIFGEDACEILGRHGRIGIRPAGREAQEIEPGLERLPMSSTRTCAGAMVMQGG